MISQSQSRSGRQCAYATRLKRPAPRNSANSESLPKVYVNPVTLIRHRADCPVQNPQWRSRLKKDPGIPNLFPFKDKILAEIEENKRLKAERAQSLRDAAKAKRNEGRDEVAMEVEEELVDEDADLVEDDVEEGEEDEANPMAALLASAQARAMEFGNDPDLDKMDEDNEDGEDEEPMDGVSLPQPTINYSNTESS